MLRLGNGTPFFHLDIANMRDSQRFIVDIVENFLSTHHSFLLTARKSHNAGAKVVTKEFKHETPTVTLNPDKLLRGGARTAGTIIFLALENFFDFVFTLFATFILTPRSRGHSGQPRIHIGLLAHCGGPRSRGTHSL